MKADSATAEDSYDALKKFARDLTEAARAGKPPPPGAPTPAQIHLGQKAMSHHEATALLAPAKETVVPDVVSSVNPAFVKFFNSIPPVPLAEVKKLPPETYDHVVPSQKGPDQFLTSDSCMGCHSAIYYGNAMVYTGQTQPDGGHFAKNGAGAVPGKAASHDCPPRAPDGRAG